MDKINKIFKLLGINKSYYPCFRKEDYKTEFFEGLPDGQLCPIRDIDKFLVRTSAVYRTNFLFQMIYSFLSQFVFENKKDLKDCENRLKNAILCENIKGVKQAIQYIRNNHKLVCDVLHKCDVDEDIEALNSYFLDTKLCKYLDEVLNDEGICSNAIVPSGLPVFGLLASVMLCWLFLRKDIAKIDFEELINRDVYEVITNYIVDKLELNQATLENKSKFLDFCYDRYFTNGFIFHGTNDFYLNNILKNGIDSNKIDYDYKLILRQNKIMEQYGIEGCFEGKVSELKYIQCYMTTKTAPMTYYSVQSPEWLSRFCSNGKSMQDCKFDRWAFYRRDYDSCRENVEKLCRNYCFSREDKTKTLKNFKALWNQTLSNKPMNPVVVLVDRKNVGKDSSENYLDVKNNLMNLNYVEILKNLVNKEKSFIRIYSRIPKNLLHIVKFPKVNSMLRIKTNASEEKWVERDGIKIKTDGVLRLTFAENKTYYYLNLVDESENNKIDKNIIHISRDGNYKAKVEDFPLDILICEFAVPVTKAFNSVLNQLKSAFKKEELVDWNLKFGSDLVEKGLNLLEKDIWESYKIYCKLVFALSAVFTIKNYDKLPNEIDPHRLHSVINRELDKNHWAIEVNRNKIIDKEQLKQNFLRIKEEWL